MTRQLSLPMASLPDFYAFFASGGRSVRVCNTLSTDADEPLPSSCTFDHPGPVVESLTPMNEQPVSEIPVRRTRGRPPIYDGIPSTRISLRIPQALCDLARARGITVHQLLNETIAKMLPEGDALP